jgi:hypothetical protein
VKLRKTLWLVALLLPATVAVLCIFLQRTAEPCYQGKSLSEWVSINHGAFVKYPDEPIAVMTIGTNALPFLVKWIQYRSHPWIQKRLPSFAQQFQARRMDLARGSVMAFGILRDRAIPAIPQLLQLLNGSDLEVGRRASAAIGVMGNSVTHDDPAVTIPPLIQASDNPDPEIAKSATHLLCETVEWHGPESHLDVVLAALIRNVGATNQSVRNCAIRGLGDLGRIAHSAVPALESAATNDPEQFNRRDATNSLRRIMKEHLPHRSKE